MMWLGGDGGDGSGVMREQLFLDRYARAHTPRRYCARHARLERYFADIAGPTVGEIVGTWVSCMAWTNYFETVHG